MQGSNVGRLLVTSSALLFPPTGLFVGALRWLVQGLVADAARMEDHIRASRVDWTIARTSFLTNEEATSYRLV